MQSPADVDTYIQSFPQQTQTLLNQLRATIKQAAPNAAELISYGMPTYKHHGALIHFAGYEKHIGLYPAPAAITLFAQELSRYKTSKGAIQLPLNEPLPLDLVTRIVMFRIADDEEKYQIKKKK